jgi:hypothetical protein
LLVLASAPATGQTLYESAQNGDWGQTTTWDPVGVPAPLSPDSAIVRHEVEVTTTAQGAGEIQVLADATLLVSEGALSCSEVSHVGSSTESGHVIHRGGSWGGALLTESALRIGGQPSATYTISGGSLGFGGLGFPTLDGLSIVGSEGDHGALVIEGSGSSVQFRALQFGTASTIGELVLRPTAGGSDGLTALQALGTLDLSSDLDVLTIEPQYALQYGDSWVVANASAGIVGEFTTVNTPVGFDASLEVIGGQLIVTVDATLNSCPIFLGQTVFAAGDGPFQIIHDDLNGDGIPDLVTVNQTSDDLSVLLGLGSGDFAPAVSYPTGDSPYDVVSGDLDGNGAPDLVVAAQNSDEVEVLLGLGDGTFVSVGAYPFPEDPVALALGDLNGDGLLDLAVASSALGGQLIIMFGNGVGGFGPYALHDVDPFPRDVSLGDLDADGDLDVVTASAFSLGLSVLLNAGDGNLQSAVSYPIALSSQAQSMVLEDLDGDGVLDAAIPSVFTGVSILFGVGDGSFGPLTIAPTPESVTDIAAGDLNADGIPDLAVSKYLAPTDLRVLLGVGDGTFQAGSSLGAPAFSRGMQVADLDGDDKPDLIHGSFTGDSVAVYRSAFHWARLPGALSGVAGPPSLAAAGCVQAESSAELLLTSAAPLAPTGLVLGLGLVNVPFKGGVMVPAPDVIVDELVTDAEGELIVPFTWPSDLPSGVSLWTQAWVVDASASRGFSASNGLRADIP